MLNEKVSAIQFVFCMFCKHCIITKEILPYHKIHTYKPPSYPPDIRSLGYKLAESIFFRPFLVYCISGYTQYDTVLVGCILSFFKELGFLRYKSSGCYVIVLKIKLFTIYAPGKWDDWEKAELSKAVHELTNTKQGESVTVGVNWLKVARAVGTRTEKQCYNKWYVFIGYFLWV